MPQLTATRKFPVVEYLTSDGQPMAEIGIHVLLMIALIDMLRDHFRLRPDVYVIGNIFLYYEEGNPAARRAPDVMVVKGVPTQPERDSFKIWEENATPSVVFELTSQGTRDEDLGPNKELYEKLRVKEYFLFDPLGDYLPRPLVGHRLIRTAENGDEEEVEARFEELPPADDGSLISAELGLRLVPAGQMLELVDLRTGMRLPLPADFRLQLESSQRVADQLREENDRMKAELNRLRSLLSPETGNESISG